MGALALLLTLASLLPAAEAKYPPVGCTRVIPMLGVDSRLLGGEIRTTNGDCIVWLSLSQHWWPSRACNTLSHEVRHLHGDQHPIPRERSCRKGR